MKKYLTTILGLTALFFLMQVLDVFAFNQPSETPGSFFGTWVSLLPPVVAIFLALTTREVILSLFAGIWVGALFITEFHLTAGTALSLSTLTDSLAESDHIAIIVFSLLLGGMVGVMSRSGGTQGAVDKLGKYARTRTQGQVFSWASALFIFFDDYANTLIRGNALRPMTDRLNISREKLAYIVDSTAAPLAVSAVITTWIGFEITQIQSSLSSLAATTTDVALAAQLEAGAANAFIIFLDSIPYLFYPILALSFVLMTILMKREFGPMLEAERRAASGRGVIREGAMPASDTNLDSMQPIEGKPKRWYNAALPVFSVLVVALYGLYITGSEGLAPAERSLTAIIGNANPFDALLWASFTGSLIAILLSVTQRILTINQAIDSWVGGMQSMLIAIIILILAWGLGGITSQIGTGPYLASLLQDSLPLALLPGIVFFIAAITAFSTGTSWGTMAILFPVVLPLTIAMGAGIGFAGGENYGILLGAISSVMAGAVFGDHCSPISDTTVLSAMSSACDLIDHVRTQLPYAILIAVVALVVGELPAAFEWIHPAWGLLAGLIILYLILKFYGENPEEVSEPVPGK
jgi:Na+/H+ antiporter NhaC